MYILDSFVTKMHFHNLIIFDSFVRAGRRYIIQLICILNRDYLTFYHLPTSPEGPVSPAGPRGPMSPFSPLLPSAPGRPSKPLGPSLPVTPVRPGTPGRPKIEKRRSTLLET